MILFWHKLKEGERSRALLDRALLAYCDAIGKRRPRKKNRSVAETEHGKPYYPALPSVFCSVSHSRGWWVCLFDKHPCGVDVEETGRSRANDAVIRRKFTPEEQALFGEQTGCADPGSAGEATFLRVWTRKEAYLKYTGEGLTRDTLSFSVAGTDAAGRPCFRGDAEPFYGEPRIVLEEIGFSSVTDPDGEPLPLIGAVCGTWSELSVLPLPEPAAEEAFEAAKEIALDLVEVRPRHEQRQPGHNRNASVVRVHKRNTEYITGVLEINDPLAVVMPQDPRMQHDVFVTLET
ncbi:MAG: 4'-phosphopantetheinyl transferase superfamily protein, partial [Firmicutes bacterium]|nr:4'-phosphopantetheinyl transferase superfamily protein [Bacillota bacterium]